MYHRPISLIAIIMLLVSIAPSHSFARLLLYTPEQIIEQADVVVVGTVTKRIRDEQRSMGEFEIKRVLKGTFNEEILTIDSEAHFGGMPPGLMQDIPEAGTEVMLFLSKYSNGKLDFTELNSVAIIKDGWVVSIHAGINTSDQRHVMVYNEFLQKASRQQATTTTHRAIVKNSQTEAENRTKSANYSKSIYAGLSALVIVIVLYLYRRRRQQGG